MRQLIWESFFIYSNHGKIKTTQKISTHELIFFLMMMMNTFLKSTIIQKLALWKMIKLYHHQRALKINAIKRQKPAFSQHTHSQDMNQKFESALRILKFVYSQWTVYSYYELLKVQQIQICNLQPEN